MRFLKQKIMIYISLIILFIGCTTISPFNQVAYQQSTSIKATALLLMNNATQPYSTHSESVNALVLEAHKAYEYAKARPKNLDSTKQWEIILNPKGHSLAGFLKRWKSEKTLGAFFVREAQRKIGHHFDIISATESAKERNK